MGTIYRRRKVTLSSKIAQIERIPIKVGGHRYLKHWDLDMSVAFMAVLIISIPQNILN
jgi:hypothetical protein